jgi:alkylhydroperoxidase/carboxymuconolactone decarboxylase family protein YurZ
LSSSSKLTPVEYLALFNPKASSAFQELRKAVLQSGPLDQHTCELITLGALVTARNETSFKTHARRLLKEDVSVEALRQAVMVTFAATTTFTDVVAGLRWVDEVAAEKAG